MKNVRDYSNLTNDELVLDEALREDVLKDLGDNILAQSDIWNLGEDSEFSYIEGKYDYYMTVDMVASLFDCDVKAVQEYYKKDSQYLSELLDAGMIYVKPFSLKESYDDHSQELKVKIAKPSIFNESVEPVSNRFHQTIGNTIVLKNVEIVTKDGANQPSVKFKGISQPVKFTKNGMWLFSLRAVIKLGMFMTGTEKARLFRDRIINQLKIDVAKTQAIKNVNTTSHNTIKGMIANGAVPSISDFKEYQEAKSKSAKLVSYSYLKQCTDELRDMRDTLANLRDSLLRVNTSKMKRLDKAEHNEKITKCNTMIEIMSDQIIENQELTENIVKDKLDNIGGKLEYQLSDIVKEHYGAASASKVNECKEKLKMLGIFEIKHPIAQKNKVDKKTGKILRKAGEVNTDIDLYLPTKDFKWINEGKFARISETAASQKFEFSECGKLFIENALFKNLIFKTKDEFISWLLDSEEV